MPTASRVAHPDHPRHLIHLTFSSLLIPLFLLLFFFFSSYLTPLFPSLSLSFLSFLSSFFLSSSSSLLQRGRVPAPGSGHGAEGPAQLRRLQLRQQERARAREPPILIYALFISIFSLPLFFSCFFCSALRRAGASAASGPTPPPWSAAGSCGSRWTSGRSGRTSAKNKKRTPSKKKTQGFDQKKDTDISSNELISKPSLAL